MGLWASEQCATATRAGGARPGSTY